MALDFGDDPIVGNEDETIGPTQTASLDPDSASPGPLPSLPSGSLPSLPSAPAAAPTTSPEINYGNDPIVGDQPTSLMPPGYRALLRTIHGSESAYPGRDPYTVMYGGQTISDFNDHPRIRWPIRNGPNAGNVTTAAGGYQFLGRSWDEAQSALDLPDFSPENQDRAAIWHAENTYRRSTGGRDLLEDINAAQGNPRALAAVGSHLSGWWTSLPGGIEPNHATRSFGDRFARHLDFANGEGDTSSPALYSPMAFSGQQSDLDRGGGGARGGKSPFDPDSGSFDLIRKMYSVPPEERRNVLDEYLHKLIGIPVDDRAKPGTMGLSRPIEGYPPFSEEEGFGARAPLPRSRPPEAPSPKIDYGNDPIVPDQMEVQAKPQKSFLQRARESIFGKPGIDYGKDPIVTPPPPAKSQERIATQTGVPTAPSDWGGYGPVIGKSLARGPIDVAAGALKASDVLAGPELLKTGATELLDELAKPQTDAGRAALMRKATEALPRPLAMDFNAALQRIASGADPGSERAHLDKQFHDWDVESKKPVKERQLYQAGEAVEKFGKETFPLTPTEEKSLTSRFTRGAGALLPLVGLGMIPGAAPAAAMVGAGVFGLQAAGETFDEAMRHEGVTEEQAAKAAGLSGLVGLAAGGLPLGVIFAPVKREMPGLMGWAAAKLQQALNSGMTFAAVEDAQHWLGAQIARAYYDPEANYEPSVERTLIALGTGALLGPLHPLAKDRPVGASRTEVDDFLRKADEMEARAAGAKTKAEIDEFIRQKDAREAGERADRVGLPKPESEAPAAEAGAPGPEPKKPTGGAPGAGKETAAEPAAETEKPAAAPEQTTAPIGTRQGGVNFLTERFGISPAAAESILSDPATARAMYPRYRKMLDALDAARGEAGEAKPKMAPDRPTAEPFKDLLAQASDLRDAKHPRQAVWLPKSSVDSLDPDQLRRIQAAGYVIKNFDRAGGTLVAKNKAAANIFRRSRDMGLAPLKDEASRNAFMQQLIGSVTGAGTGKPAAATSVVQQVTPEGDVTRETAVTPEQVKGAEEELAAPGRDVRTVTTEAALQRREEEIAAEKKGETEADLSKAFDQALESQFAEPAAGTRHEPVKAATPEDIAVAGAVAEQPKSQAHADAGNYQKGHLRFAPESPLHGLKISIETGKGEPRQKVDDKTGEVLWREDAVPGHYGHFIGVPARSQDGEHPDVIVGDDPTSDRAFVVNQYDPKTKRFDETKSVVAVRTQDEAISLYDRMFSDGSGPSRRSSVVEMSVDRLKGLLQEHDWTKPVRREKEEKGAQTTPPMPPMPPMPPAAEQKGEVASAPSAPSAETGMAKSISESEAPPAAEPVAPKKTPATLTVDQAKANLEQAKKRYHELQRRLDALDRKLETPPPTPRNALDKERIEKNRSITERIARGLRRKTADALDAVDDARKALKQAQSQEKVVPPETKAVESPVTTKTTEPLRSETGEVPTGEMPDIPDFLKRKKETPRVEEATPAEAAKAAEAPQVPVPAEAGAHAEGEKAEVTPKRDLKQIHVRIKAEVEGEKEPVTIRMTADEAIRMVDRKLKGLNLLMRCLES
jgi:muramidase (phage lysozyme)